MEKQIDEQLKQELFPRDILKEILIWLDDYQSLILTGSRQVGKTFIMYLIIKHLLDVKKINPKDIFYIDLENFDNLQMLNQGAKSLINYIEINSKSPAKKYVFIDEIQYLDNPSGLIKLLVDEYRGKVKVIASGSSALTIKRKFKDSMAGRKISFEIDSLNFREFLRFKKHGDLADEIEKFNNLLKLPSENKLAVFQKELLLLFEEFVTYGGYPAIVLEQNTEKRKTLLQNLYGTYIRKDLNVLFDLENINAFNKLLTLLSLQAGNLINLQSTARELGIAHKTAEKYLSILEETFIIKTVRPFYKNKKRELIKMPKVYFLDLGMRNKIINDFRSLNLRVDAGALLENAVYKALRARFKNHEEIKYWRTKSGNEIDFIIDQNNLLVLEIKSKSIEKIHIPPAFNIFNEQYHYQKAFLLNKTFYKKIKNFVLLPYYCL